MSLRMALSESYLFQKFIDELIFDDCIEMYWCLKTGNYSENEFNKNDSDDDCDFTLSKTSKLLLFSSNLY